MPFIFRIFIIRIFTFRFSQFKIACINLIAECNLSFHLIQSAGFRELIELVTNFQLDIPPNAAIMDTLSAQSKLIKLKMMEAIKQQPHICATADIWSSRAQSYFGMTVHWINSNYERESFLLAFRQMKKRQTNKEITDLIREIFHEYNINSDNVTHIITDGGSSFCKAFKLYGKSSDTLIDPFVGNSNSYDDDLPSNTQFMQYDDGEAFYSNIIDLDANENGNFSDLETDFEIASDSDLQNNSNDLFTDAEELIAIDLESEENPNPVIESEESATQKLPPHKRCLSHVLNLLANDFKQALSGPAKRAWVSTLSKLQAIWVFPRLNYD